MYYHSKNTTSVALVTGGSRGIGASIAQRLAADGFAVAIGYCNNQGLAELISSKINTTGAQSIPIKIDVSDRSSVQAALSQINQKLGPIDILINNAAISQEKPFLEITEDDWDSILATNLRGPFFCIQETLPSMIKKNKGRIINIVSIGGQWGGINQIHYASAKAGLVGLTKSIAKTFSAQGITCNAIAPGLVSTDMTRNELNSIEGHKKLMNIPVGRLGTVDEISAAVSFLVSPESEYITGQTLNINGGMYFG